MKEIKIKEITLENWRGLNSRVVFGDKETLIEGRNKIGKSSILSAWSWLLTSYTEPTNVKNFNLFDNRKEIDIDTPIASVKAIISINDLKYTIERRAKAKFTRDKGTNEYIKSSSDEYTILVDNVVMSVSNWEDFVRYNLGVEPKHLPYIINGLFFSALTIDSKDDARNVLLSLVGEIKEEEYSGDYSCLKERMAKGYNLDQIEEQAKNIKKDLEISLIEKPKVIESREKLLVEHFEVIDFDGLERNLIEERNKLEKIEDALFKGKVDNTHLLKEISELESYISSLKNGYEKAKNDSIRRITSRIDDAISHNLRIDSENDRRERDFKELERNLAFVESKYKTLEERRLRLVERRNDIKSRVFVGERCAYCGQELPEDRLNDMLVEFNKKKEEDLEFVVAEGKAIKKELESLENELKSLKEKVSLGYSKGEYIDVAPLKKELKDIEDSCVPFENTEEYISLSNKLKALKENYAKTTISNDNTPLLEEKKAIVLKIDEINRNLGLKETRDKLRKEIIDLRNEARELGVELAMCEKIIMKVKERREETANIVSVKVNKFLHKSHIEMFSRKRDGKIIPNCVIRDEHNVNYLTINNSTRLLVDVEMQRLFMDMYDIVFPIFIDECNVFDTINMPKFDTQAIYLKASDDYILKVTTKD
jgi:hypothetical protein